MQSSFKVHVSNGELSDPQCDSVNRGLTLVRLGQNRPSFPLLVANGVSSDEAIETEARVTAVVAGKKPLSAKGSYKCQSWAKILAMVASPCKRHILERDILKRLRLCDNFGIRHFAIRS